MELTRAEAFSYHIGTRNYFAYLLRKPIVGEDFGVSLAHLWKRIEVWQPHSSASDVFQEYCREQGYLNLAGNLDYASAALYWSELARARNVWIEAFVHCVAMDGQFDQEAKARLSSSTRALISKASRDMHMHVSKVTRSLGAFLEQELGTEKVGLTKPLRDHLDRFRSMLHSYYVNEVGYFPPAPSEPWDKRLWSGMYDDFRSLYKYLVDDRSSTDLASGHGLGGGMCVTQHVRAFDQSNAYHPLPHPLPLLPELSTRTARMSLSHMRKSRTMLEQESLELASNSNNCRSMANKLVQAYIRFERQSLYEKITPVEARKVRWLLVYGVLQKLISMTKAPKEVRDTDTPSYPLCVSNEGLPSWLEEEDMAAQLTEPATAIDLSSMAGALGVITPDCEAQTAEDYFSQGYSPRRGSKYDAPTTQPMSRAGSIRSGVNSFHKSMVGSLTRRSSRTRSSSIAPSLSVYKPAQSFQEIVVEEYGNGAEPSLSYSQISHINTALNPDVTSYFSDDSPTTTYSSSSWSDRDNRSSTSTASSSRRPYCESPGTEMSFQDDSSYSKPVASSDLAGFEFGFQECLPVRNSYVPTKIITTETITTKTITTTTFEEREDEDAEEKAKLDLEEYLLAAEIPLPLTPSDARAKRAQSPCSIRSYASSLYPDEDMQAAEIEETDVRGRRRLRGMDRLTWVATSA
jgi:hypothetical protein